MNRIEYLYVFLRYDIFLGFKAVKNWNWQDWQFGTHTNLNDLSSGRKKKHNPQNWNERENNILESICVKDDEQTADPTTT